MNPDLANSNITPVVVRSADRHTEVQGDVHDLVNFFIKELTEELFALLCHVPDSWKAKIYYYIIFLSAWTNIWVSYCVQPAGGVCH